MIQTWVCWETPQNMLFDGDDHTDSQWTNLDSLKSRILKEPIGTVLVFGPLKPQAKVMRQEDVEVNLQQCNMCITAFGRMTRWQDAVDVFSTMPDMRVLPDVISYNATIHALKASWQKALDLFAEMPRTAHVVPNAVTYNTTMSACAASGQWEMALAFLNEMPKVKACPSAFSFCTVPWICCTHLFFPDLAL